MMDRVGCSAMKISDSKLPIQSDIVIAFSEAGIARLVWQACGLKHNRFWHLR